MIQKITIAYHQFKLILFLGLLFPLIWFGIRPAWNNVTSDFPNYYVSAQLLLKGKLNEAYDVNQFNNHIAKYNTEAKGLFVMYPPTTALTTIFLTPFDMMNAKRFWLILSLIATVGIIFLLSKLVNIHLIDASNLVLISGFNLYNDLMLGQVYIMMVFLLFLAWFLHFKNKIIMAGIALGIVAAIKFLPLFFLPILIYKKHYKISVVIVTICILLHSITLLVGGLDAYKSFINVFKQNYLSGHVANDIATSIQYQSMEVFANVLNQKLLISEWICNGMKLVWKLFWIILCCWACFKYFYNTAFTQISMASITLLLLLFENGSATYHLLFCLLALVLVLKSSFALHWKIIILLAYILMGFLPFFIHLMSVDNFILIFSRLWCLSIFSGLFFIGLRKQNFNTE